MALDVATGQLSIGTGAPTTVVTVSGLSFQPKVVLFSWSGRTANGQAEGDSKPGYGYMVGSADRGCVTGQSDHGIGTSATDAVLYDDACIALLTTAGAVDGKADFNAFASDGFSVIIDDTFAADYLINYIAIGGGDLTNVASVTVGSPAGTGNQDTTTVGFQPDAALLFTAGGLPVNTPATGLNVIIGAAAGSTPTSYVCAIGDDDAAGSSVTMSYTRSGDILAGLAADTVFARASLSAWLSNGFRLNWSETPGTGVDYRVLCFKGGSWAVGDFLSSTSGTNFSETGLTFKPKGLVLASSNRAASSSDTTSAGGEQTVGFAVSSSARNSVGFQHKDAQNTMDIGVAQHSDNCYSNQSTASTVAVEGLMDVVSMNSDGFTMVMDDTDPSQTFVWYLAFGDTPIGTFSSDGVGAADFTGASRATSTFSSDGVGDFPAVGASRAVATLSSDGVGDLTGIGQSRAVATLSSDGVGALSGVGESRAVGTLSSDGVGALTGVGESRALSTLSSDGTSTADFVDASEGGETEEAGDLASDGTSTASFVGQSLFSGTLSADGVGDAIFLAESFFAAIMNGDGVGAFSAVGDSVGGAPSGFVGYIDIYRRVPRR